LRWLVWVSSAAASLAMGACYPNADELRGPKKGTGSGGAVGTASGGAPGTASGGSVGTGSGGAGPGSGGRSGSGGAPAGTGGYSGDGTALVANGMGWINGTTNAFGIQGSWYAYADGQGWGGTGPGACQEGGYKDSDCSTFTAPRGATFPPTAGGMCTAGSVGRVLNNAMGQPDYDHIWGAGIGFDFATTATTPTVIGPYNAPAKGVAGIAFDLDMVPSTGIRIDFSTPETENNPASWGGLTLALSPVKVGRNEIRWAEVGGPNYLAPPPAFDPTRLRSMHFHIPADPAGPGTFRFCISNLAVLTR
jgi:hypothetical protein